MGGPTCIPAPPLESLPGNQLGAAIDRHVPAMVSTCGCFSAPKVRGLAALSNPDIVLLRPLTISDPRHALISSSGTIIGSPTS